MRRRTKGCITPSYASMATTIYIIGPTEYESVKSTIDL